MNTLQLTTQMAGTLMASIRFDSGFFLGMTGWLACVPLSRNQVRTPAAMSMTE
ncbi:hypothetical protein D3C76_1732690 [compost metagenome]